ncbi:MAG: arylamine N-acetyltransferase [Thermomicrobiales bacterium]|nr:arylamine N-acetyltransferase [Thermomicrobiales bacterium]
MAVAPRSRPSLAAREEKVTPMDDASLVVATEPAALDDWVARYLALLGLEREPPSLPALAAITRAHLREVAFENITSHQRRAASTDGSVPPIDLDRLLANWEGRQGGGVCFEIASMVSRLLQALGYEATVVLGQISLPGAHQAVVVDIEGSRSLVDVGCGSPIVAPIPLSGETEVRFAGLAYRFRPGETADEWVQDRWIDGAWAPFCRYDLRPADAAGRNAGYQRHHTPGASWVLGPPRIIRFRDDAVVSLTGDELTTYTSDDKRTERLANPDYPQLAAELFDLPAMPIADVVRAAPLPAQGEV